ncbi:MAG: XrtA/PEP-CTERM system histidine kinase PrsK, partial [Pseudomonadota bacterium]
AYVAGAVLSAGASLWIARNGDKSRPDRTAALAAIVLTGLWCVLAAAMGPDEPSVRLIETARNLAWIAVVFRLFANDGRDESLRPTRPVIIILAIVQMLQPVLLVIETRFAITTQLEALTFEVSAVFGMLVAIGALVLLHNLYVGAAAESRRILRWSGAALAGIWGYDLNLYAIAYFSGQEPGLLVALRGLVTGAFVGVMALGANARGANLEFRPSRAVTFQTLSLLVIGSYLLLMGLVTKSLTFLGGDFGRAAQVVFLAISILAAIIWLPSQRVRGWLRVTATKHLFQHRYDYREEWLRFTRTVGSASAGSANGPSFHERAVKAVADITDSPAGLLLVPNEEAQLELIARWNWPTIAVPAIAAEYELSSLLERHSHILDLDEVRAGHDHVGELALVPEWLTEADDVWALVPLIHFDRLVGTIVLARPRIERRLDWEDFDLLRVVGQQLASYLAEQSGQQALMEASRFDEFNRRIAFVMHDIKNLASQLSLLARNAEKHAENPEFRADMLVTLRSSSDKLTNLLARLGRYGSGQGQERREIDLASLAKHLAKRFEVSHPVQMTRIDSAIVLADHEGLEQALIHLVQNAVDASEPDKPIYIDVSSDGLNGRLDVVDSGAGMSPGFVRNGLFKPFVSSKDGGFGIGAFEAREIIKAMGGRVNVESREGLGTRFSIILPLREAAQMLANEAQQHKSGEVV